MEAMDMTGDNVNKSSLLGCKSLETFIERNSSIDDQIEGYEYVRRKIDRYRKELSVQLNDMHGESFDEKGWGMILDSWLSNFVSAIYDRVNRASCSLETDGNDCVEKERITPCPPVTAHHFREMITQSEFNQYLHQIADHVLTDRRYEILPEGGKCSPLIKEKGAFTCLKSHLMKAIRGVLRQWVRWIRPVMIFDGYFCWRDAAMLAIMSMGRVMILPSRVVFDVTNDTLTLAKIEADWEKRTGIHISEEDVFDKVANIILMISLPFSMLEQYSMLRVQADKYSYAPAVGSATGFHSSDTYKILCALVARNKGKIAGIQHGGNYNILEYQLGEMLEKKNSDIWYAWGSAGENPMPSVKARKLKNYCNNDKADRILFVSTSPYMHRRLQNVEKPPEYFLNAVEEQFWFFNQLDSITTEKFVLRPYPVDRGWRYRERWDKKYDGLITFDSYSDYYSSLANTRIVVTDHFSTTWLEALCFDVPLVVYHDMDALPITEKGRKYFDRMRSVSILHDNAESAALFINRIYSDVGDWWMSEQTRDVVNELKNAFISESDAFLKIWEGELMSHRDS